MCRSFKHRFSILHTTKFSHIAPYFGQKCASAPLSTYLFRTLYNIYDKPMCLFCGSYLGFDDIDTR